MVAVPRLVIAAPASGCGKTTVACGLMAALRARGPGGLRAQGRPGLHRSRLPRPGHRQAAAEPGSLPVRRGPDRAAVPARRGRRAGRRRRRRDGPVRRRAIPRLAWTRATAPPRTWPGCSARPWCSWWTRPGPGVRSPRWRPASPPSTRGLRSRRDLEPGRVRPARTPAPGGPRLVRHAGLRRDQADRGNHHAVPAPRPDPRGRTRSDRPPGHDRRWAT